MAKAPVPGEVKTRVARSVGDSAAAELAAAALLDTMDAVEAWVDGDVPVLALAGDLSRAARAAEIRRRLRQWTVVAQRGPSFAQRLVHAHHDAAGRWHPEAVVVQIGMDTPTIGAADLELLAARVDCLDPRTPVVALGPAADGGWWGIATRRPRYVDGLAAVEMSRPDTAIGTVRALERRGVRTTVAHTLADMDTYADAVAAARQAPGSRVAAVMAQLTPTGDSPREPTAAAGASR